MFPNVTLTSLNKIGLDTSQPRSRDFSNMDFPMNKNCKIAINLPEKGLKTF